MADMEDSVPWEVRLLQSYCHSESDLNEVSTSAHDWLEKKVLICLCGQFMWPGNMAYVVRTAE